MRCGICEDKLSQPAASRFPLSASAIQYPIASPSPNAASAFRFGERRARAT